MTLMAPDAPEWGLNRVLLGALGFFLSAASMIASRCCIPTVDAPPPIIICASILPRK